MDATDRISTFNFCDPFDIVLPDPDGCVGEEDRLHLWGLYTGLMITDFTIPGLEWTAKENRMHFDAGGTRCHCTLKENRMHFDVPGDT